MLEAAVIRRIYMRARYIFILAFVLAGCALGFFLSPLWLIRITYLAASVIIVVWSVWHRGEEKLFAALWTISASLLLIVMWITALFFKPYIMK